MDIAYGGKSKGTKEGQLRGFMEAKVQVFW